MTAYFDCLASVWKPIVTSAGSQWRDPVLTFYDETIDTPCGASPDPASFPAFYCPSNQTIYVSSTGLRLATLAGLVSPEIITHEYGHHIQFVTGIMRAATAASDSSTTRRLELQAHCFAFATITHVDGFNPTAGELDEVRQTWNVPSDPEGHGSPKAKNYWGEAGISATTLKACDTFSASADLVN